MSKIQCIFSHIHPKNMSPDQAKTFYAIKNCRTATLGAHVNRCQSCEHTEILYNSCRNRHCPICQNSKQHEWVQKQLSKLLPIPYFHVVFTLPQELNTIILQNQQLLYSILMKSAANTLKELAQTPKFLGAQIGITSVLHTWGQNLSFHPHLHCIVPGGGLSNDGLRFIQSSKKFFIPVKVISRKFRGNFLYHLKQAWNEGKIKLFNNALELLADNNFLNFLTTLYNKDWIVFCKKPFNSPHHVVKYLGRYTHRVAISDARIQEFDDSMVIFKWKDYKDHSKVKFMKLQADEFVRRFLLHVLPSGFTKIRHYGILSSRNINTKLLLCIKLTNGSKPALQESKSENLCPVCGGPVVLAGLFFVMSKCT